MNTKIFKATVTSAFGEFLFAVDSTEFDAKSDILTAALSEFNCPAGMIRVKDIAKSNRRIVKNMCPVKNAQVNGKQWAWVAA